MGVDDFAGVFGTCMIGNLPINVAPSMLDVMNTSARPAITSWKPRAGASTTLMSASGNQLRTMPSKDVPRVVATLTSGLLMLS